MTSSGLAAASAVRPAWATEGGRVRLEAPGLRIDGPLLPDVRIGDAQARVIRASSGSLTVVVPPGIEGRQPVRISGLAGDVGQIDIGVPLATGLHQVDNPVFDRTGTLYVTYSGARGQQAPVSIFRVPRSAGREPFVTGLVNPTSMALDRHGRLYVSSRFEGSVYRVAPDGKLELVAGDLGVACGLAFDDDDSLFVGDRSGTIFRFDAARGQAKMFASLPPSVAAFHLAYGPDRCLYVTAPTLASYDHVYRIDPQGRTSIVYSGFGRPQGLTFAPSGALYVVEALAGVSGLYRVEDGHAEVVVAGSGLVGVAIDPLGGLIVVSSDTAYRLDVNL
jgi:sugar lactone lactonase YvrE